MSLGVPILSFCRTVVCLVVGIGAAERISLGQHLEPSTSATASVPPEMRLSALPLRAPEPKDNPTTDRKVALGRLLFFDPILSSTRDVSCATCHHPRFGWGDGRSTPIGIGGVGIGPTRWFTDPNGPPALDRNAPSLLNVGFNGLVTGTSHDASTAPMFWDSRTASLEQQVVAPIKTRGEMCGENCREDEAVAQAVHRVKGIVEYRKAFQEIYGDGVSEVVTPLHLAQVIAAFERSLVTPSSAFDRFIGGDETALSTEARRGLRVFQDAGCIQCHGGPMFSDFKLHFIGVADSTAGGRREFRTPSLRNLRHTAPFMHNGVLRTLRDVLVFYEELAESVSETLDGADSTTMPRLDPLLRHLNVNADDFVALEAFLETLNATDYDVTVPRRVPSGLSVIP